VTEYRPALVVIDVQNGFITPDSAHVVPVIADLAARRLDAGGRVVFTRYRNYPGSPYERLLGWHGLQGPPDTDLAPELAELAVHPLASMTDKVTYTALDDAGLEALEGFTDLLICGIATDGCVMKTALDAFELGFTPWVLADACASNATRHNPQTVHEAALMLTGRLIGAGQMITTEMALSLLPVGAQ